MRRYREHLEAADGGMSAAFPESADLPRDAVAP